MSNNPYYDKSDLLALPAGLRVVDDSGAAQASNRQDYWTKVVDGERKGRDIQINWDWVKSPKDAWRKVKWRDWLVEPSMGLSPLLVRSLFNTLHEINQAGTTMLLVEQNAHLALKYAARAYVLESGNIVLSGTAQDIAQNPLVKKAYLGG